MTSEVPPIDWHAFYEPSINGQLMELLAKLRRERWAERDKYGSTLLHYACRGPNLAAVVALLQSGLVDVSARNKWGNTPAHWASYNTQPRVLEVLCAAGADMRARNANGETPIDAAMRGAPSWCVHVLVANGVRLSTVREDNHKCITPELEAFERGVLCCRAAVVAMLRVKRAGQLRMWDKFLLLDIALCIWATRYDKGWQRN